MTRLELDPDLERLGEALHASTTIDLAREKRTMHLGRRARPRLLAGATGVVAASATGVVLLVGASAAPPAFAITRSGDGSVLVNINRLESLPAANSRLTQMGIREQVTIYMATGAAPVSGPVTCTAGPGAGPPKPPVKILVGRNGTEVIGTSQSAGNTGEGTFHLARCTVAPNSDTGPGTGNTGNTGAG